MNRLINDIVEFIADHAVATILVIASIVALLLWLFFSKLVSR